MAEAFFFSGSSVMSASVVSSRAATLAAFWSAVRATLVGSMIPALNMSTYSVRSLSPPVQTLGPQSGHGKAKRVEHVQPVLIPRPKPECGTRVGCHDRSGLGHTQD